MPTVESVYIIYSADVISPLSVDIERMSPATHVRLSVGEHEQEAAKRIAEAFTETEGDDQYEYGYLGNESGDVRYFPAGYVDSEGFTTPEDKLEQLKAEIAEVYERGVHVPEKQMLELESLQETADDPPVGMGQHRKWCGELSREDWLVFANAYGIELDDDGLPTNYTDTLGSLTAEYGHIPAVSVDNTEGWDRIGFGYGAVEGVLDSSFYISVATSDDSNERTGVTS